MVIESSHAGDQRSMHDTVSTNVFMDGVPLLARMAAPKVITDTVHGTIRLEPLTRDLLETLELQRLNSIRQLGLTYLVFPGANHSRLEHCLGVGHVAGEMAKSLDLPESERKLVQAAGQLHDVGHGPFSHTLEHVLSRELDVDHMDITQRILTGEDDNVSGEDRKAFPNVPRIPEVLEANGLSPSDVAAPPPPGDADRARPRGGARPPRGGPPRDDRLRPPHADPGRPSGRTRPRPEGPARPRGDARGPGPHVLLRVLPQDGPDCGADDRPRGRTLRGSDGIDTAEGRP